MVYEKECSECGKILDFGGEDHGNLPENGMEFDGELYCRECVEKFVKFGVGDIRDRLAELEHSMKKVKDQLGLEKH